MLDLSGDQENVTGQIGLSAEPVSPDNAERINVGRDQYRVINQGTRKGSI